MGIDILLAYTLLRSSSFAGRTSVVRRGVQSGDQPPRRHHCTAELTSEGPRRSGSPGMQPRRKQSRELPRILLMRVQGLTFSTAFRAKKSEDFGPVTRKPICKFASCFRFRFRFRSETLRGSAQ